MINSVSGYSNNVYTTGSFSNPKPQPAASPTAATSSDQVSISQTGKALAANSSATPSYKTTALEHLAQNKLEYEQKQAAAKPQTADRAPPSAIPVNNNSATPSYKTTALEHLAQHKLEYEQKQAATNNQRIGSYRAIQAIIG